ncbi:MAG: RNA polymerase sigma factor [Acidobacteria bacterium]|nr:RNA polymerase sigma factor [Acidobacteriota bacterium]
MPIRAGEWLAHGSQPEWTMTVVEKTQGAPRDAGPLAELDDHGLVAACLAGRRDAFDLLVDRHKRSVYLLCYRFVGTHEDASDLSQDVFLRAYRGLRRFRGDSSFATWLYRIGVNVCLNRVSMRQPLQRSLDEMPNLAAPQADPAVALVRREEARRVRAAVARLPRKQRTALILRVYHDLPHKEIASALGTSVGAVKANFFHALANLKKLLAADTRSGS